MQYYDSSEVEALRNALRNWVEIGLLPSIQGLNIWDVGCGYGCFSTSFIEEGASHVIASDVIIDFDKIPAELIKNKCISIVSGDTEKIAPLVFQGHFGPVPDLIFMHLMTEHVANFKDFIYSLKSNMTSNCSIFINHDNYYQPVGHHDHSFLFLNDKKFVVEPKTIPCWESADRCLASKTHRHNLPIWQWSERSESTVGTDCNQCNYKLRSEPWAHLINQPNFNKIWPEALFKNMLNKITIFQLKQILIEAGFVIVGEQRVWINNAIPENIICEFSKNDLNTFAYTLLAKPDNI